MTENLFAQVPDDAGEGSSRRTLLLGGALGVAVLAGAGWFLLHSGSSSDSTDFSLPTPHRATVAHKPAKATTLKSTVPTTRKVPAASSVKIGHDPFAALYMAPVVQAAAPPTASTSATSPTSSTSTTSAMTNTAANQRYTIVLTKVTTVPGGAKVFTFKIGTTSKDVLPAQRFGKYGELVVLTYLKNSKGAVVGAILQVGDDNPIEVPIGVKVSVQ